MTRKTIEAAKLDYKAKVEERRIRREQKLREEGIYPRVGTNSNLRIGIGGKLVSVRHYEV